MTTKEDFNSLPKIVAVDFDGTLVEDSFPEIGKPYTEMFDIMKYLRSSGVKVILWTSRNFHRNRDLLEEAIQFCKEQGLEFDAINENVREVQELTGEDTRKVYADLYVDDKSIHSLQSPLYWLNKVNLSWVDYMNYLMYYKK